MVVQSVHYTFAPEDADKAEALGTPMVVGSAVRQILAIGTASQGADADMTELIKVMEDWAGVVVESK